MQKKLTKGVGFPLTNISGNIFLKNLEDIQQQGNHKSADAHRTYLSEVFSKEVQKRWLVILPDANLLDIPGLKLAPMGVQR